MTAKEFYELNKGKYFMYYGEKVKLVGYRKDYPPEYLIITCSDGCTNEEDYNVIDPSLIDSESLFDGEWRFYYVVERQLNPVEPQELNLCKILEGCEGITLYSPIHGDVVLESINNLNTDPIIVTLSDGDYIDYCKDGRYLAMYNGECMLFPSKENRDWSTFKKPIKDDDWVVACDGEGCGHINKYCNINRTWKYVIPFEKYNPNLTKEELKKLSIV